MKSFEDKLDEETSIPEPGLKKDHNEKCPDCSRKILWNRKGVECERYEQRFYTKSQTISNEEYKTMGVYCMVL